MNKPILKSRSLSVALTLALLNAIVPAAFAAEPTRKVLILRPQSDTLAEPDKDAGLLVLREALAKYPGVVLLDSPKIDLLDTMMDLNCTDVDDECFGKIGKHYGADEVLYTDVVPVGAGFEVRSRLVDVRAQKTIKSPTTSATTKGDLAAAFSTGLAGAYGQLPKIVDPVKPPDPVKPKDPEKVSVDFRSSPAGATISLNGTRIGVTPISVKLKPGKYRATMVLDGYERIESREVEVVVAGPNSPLFELKALPAAVPVVVEDDDGGTPYYKAWWFWTAIGVAVVGTTVGLAVGLTQEDEAAPAGALRFGFGNPDIDPAVQGANR